MCENVRRSRCHGQNVSGRQKVAGKVKGINCWGRDSTAAKSLDHTIGTMSAQKVAESRDRTMTCTKEAAVGAAVGKAVGAAAVHEPSTSS